MLLASSNNFCLLGSSSPIPGPEDPPSCHLRQGSFPKSDAMIYLRDNILAWDLPMTSRSSVWTILINTVPDIWIWASRHCIFLSHDIYCKAHLAFCPDTRTNYIDSAMTNLTSWISCSRIFGFFMAKKMIIHGKQIRRVVWMWPSFISKLQVFISHVRHVALSCNKMGPFRLTFQPVSVKIGRINNNRQ